MTPDAFSTSVLEKLRQAVAQGLALTSIAAFGACAKSERSAGSVAAAPTAGTGAAIDQRPPGQVFPTDASNAGREPSAGSQATAGTTAPVQTAQPNAGSGSDTEDADALIDASAPLMPYPIDALGCWGPNHNGPYFGQCCVKAHCEPPLPGGDCPAKPQIAQAPSGFPPNCACAIGPADVATSAGPYAPNPADMPDFAAGSCCYLVGSITCTGRPLVVEGQWMIAALTPRRDWATFA